MKKKGSIVLCMLVMSSIASAMQFSDLVQVAFKPMFHVDKRFEFAVLAEHGFKVQSFDENGCVANALRIWNADQNALKMLYGFSPESAIGELNTRIDAADDGIRGHFLVDGCLTMPYNISLAARFRFLDYFIFGVYLPARSVRLSNVVWHNQTKDVTDEDQRVRAYLTDNFFAHVQELGCLDLQGWCRAGLGDMSLLLEWMRDFPQPKPMLKNVRLNARLGLTVPTGLKQDVDKIFALPFGYNGAYGLIFGGGLDLTWGSHVKAGLDVQLHHVFGNTSFQRIKTDVDQTELLLLAKTCAFKDWGLTQQFNLYIEFFQFFKGLSLKTDYQFTKHGEDSLSLTSNDFSTQIANTANSLQEWTAHYAIITALYDFGYDLTNDMRARPTLSFFVKAPFNGKQAALFSTVGAVLSVDF